MARRFVLLGPPASGKGTQGRRLAEEFGLAYLSTGALLRSAVEEGTALGKQAAPILDRHEYLPDPLMCSIMGEWLSGQDHGWVLDGFPRSADQADFLAGWLADRKLSLDAAILLEVPEAELLERVRARVECPDCRWSGQRDELTGAGLCPKCGGAAGPRADDSPAGFQSRYAEYREHTQPIIARYEKEGRLLRLDASRPPDATEKELLKIVESSHGQTA